MPTTTLNPAGMIIVLGDIVFQGFPKGDYAAITYNDDAFTEVVGVDGEHTRVMSGDFSATFVGTIQQSSITNTKLSRMLNEDRRTGNKRGDFLYKDPRGETELKGKGAYIKKMADITAGNEVKMNAWTIYIPNLSGILGGNPGE